MTDGTSTTGGSARQIILPGSGRRKVPALSKGRLFAAHLQALAKAPLTELPGVLGERVRVVRTPRPRTSKSKLPLKAHIATVMDSNGGHQGIPENSNAR